MTGASGVSSLLSSSQVMWFSTHMCKKAMPFPTSWGFWKQVIKLIQLHFVSDQENKWNGCSFEILE